MACSCQSIVKAKEFFFVPEDNAEQGVLVCCVYSSIIFVIHRLSSVRKILSKYHLLGDPFLSEKFLQTGPFSGKII